jgi:hypothetical protein
MPAEQARDVFFALKSDRSQRDITLAAGKTALAEHPALWKRFESAIREVNELTGERNAAVHTMWTIEWEFWGLQSLYFPRVRVAPGAARHGRLADDFSTLFAKLNEKFQELLVELYRIRDEFRPKGTGGS